jgi:hypothetical protein
MYNMRISIGERTLAHYHRTPFITGLAHYRQTTNTNNIRKGEPGISID